ncbi:MAG TPA: Ig-like domain-containing protein [Hymenobacter sp.]|uniref:Ig-like domain-containing protein n=1 Tax=Hymenobacter sp. TaxID=1898978 RepID=UPI002D7F6AFB|nr:Ig-like domain-containing protein [Hymenobacter sp.]HET9503537.1 Ig-like domain-containing protein [Hymenobacter sp.]
MKHAYPLLVPRPLAALALLLATAGATHAQRGALVKTTAPQADPTRPAAQARPMPATVTTYLPVGTTAQARQQTQTQTAAAVATTTVTFANTQQGWFSPQFGHNAGNPNYIVGTYDGSGRSPYRNFFTFSLAGLNLTGKQVVSATLSLANGQSTAIPNSTVTYALYDVSTPAATLGTTYTGGNSVVTSVFNDLGTGQSYGSFVNTAASTGRRVYTLAAPALADITARAGQNFSLGGMLLEEQATVDNFLFGLTGGDNSATGQQILTLELADAQAITTGAVSPAVCAGAALSVPFTAAGTFAAGNVFTAQLSDAAGSFAAPVAIGTLASTSGGTIAATVPAATAGGGGYRVRVVSSNPAVTGTDNGSAITITALPTITMLSPATGPVGTQVTITGTNFTGATVVRFGDSPASSFVVNSATSITAVVAPGTITSTVRVSTACGSAFSSAPFVVRTAPTTVADSYSTPQGVTLTGNVLTNDLGTNPRAILITRPANGTLALNPNGSFTYVPNAGFTGTDSFTYYACDMGTPLLCGNPATVTISVLRIAPVTVADSYTTPAGTPLTGNVLTNDLGTNPRAILITRPANGSLVLNPDGSFRYVPNAGFTGTDSFTYYACDPNMPLLCGNPATVTITVTRVAPTTVADSYTTPQGMTLTGNVLTNDLGTNPRAILITRATNGTLVLNPNGSFTYVPNAGFTGTDSFTYYACDPAMPLLCGNPATVTITVTRVAPVTVADSYTTPAGTTLTGNVLANDLGTNPRAILINRPMRGTLVLNPNGSFSYQPNAGFSGMDSFTYYACDPAMPLLCGSPATVSITVTPANTAARPTTPAQPAAPAAKPAAAAAELALTGSPNPFGEQLRLSFALPTAQAYTLAVYDAQGRLVQQLASGQVAAGQAQELAVPTQGYAPGLYFVRLSTAAGTQLLKLLKQ